MQPHRSPARSSRDPETRQTQIDARLTEAVSVPTGPVVVLGEPGTGKTTAVALRAAHLVCTGTAAGRVLVAALSRASAEQLARALARHAGPGAPPVVKLHALALGLVRRHHREAGYKRPPQALAAREAWRHLRRSLERDDPAMWRHYAGALGSRSLLALLSDLIAGAAANALSADEVEAALVGGGRPDLVELAGFQQRYRARLRDECLLDAEGAVLEALRLLERQPDLAAEQRARHPHLLLDEFEQATCAQARLVRLLASEGLFVAGNPDAGTNSYQGGSPAHLRELAADPNATVVTLQTPLHTRPGIARACGRLVADALPAPDETGEPDEVVVRDFGHQREEVAWLDREIASLLRDGIAPDEVAVLFRSGDDPVARALAQRLADGGVPVRAMERAVSVEGDPLVVAAIDVLRFLLAPAPERPARFLRLLASPLGGLTPAEVRWVRRLAAMEGASVLDLASRPGGPALPSRLSDLVAGLAAGLREMEGVLDGPPEELLWRVWSAFPAFAVRERVPGGRDAGAAGHPAAFRALLEEVARVREDTPSVTALDVVRLYEAGQFGEVTVSAAPGGLGGVWLTTIHQSRGASWRFVFIPNVVEQVYPLRRSPVGSLAPLLLRGDGEPGAVRSRLLAEERRLLAVAVSRARERVHVTHSAAAFDGATRLVPSRYLPLIGPSATAPPDPEAGVDRLGALVAGYRRALWRLGPALAGGAAGREERMEAAGALYALGRAIELFPDRVDPAGWWDLVDETRGADAPYPDGVLHLSASRLTTYRQCPLRYRYAYHLALDDVTSDAMTLGTLLHAVLQEYHRPGGGYPRTLEALLALLDSRFDESRFSRPAVARQLKRRAEEMLRLYFPLYGGHEAKAVEACFRFHLGPHVIRGFIDRIDELPDGSLELIDYKTGGAMSQEDARDDLQLALYELAFHHDARLAELGTPSVVTYLYPAAISEKLAARAAAGGGPKGRGFRGRGDGARSYQPTEEGRRRLLERIDRCSRGILEGRFPSRSGIRAEWPDLGEEELRWIQRSDPCRSCGFTWLCPERERGMAGV